MSWYKMRVCIIGDVTEPLDEGMKKTTYHLSKAISKHCDVLVLNPFKVFKSDFWSALREHNPHIIHYVPGPTLRSFILLALTKVLCSATSVVSLTHPDPHLPKRFVAKFLKPDLILAQSGCIQESFSSLGCNTKFIPNGVDTEKFHPISDSKKKKLREKYRLCNQDFIVLHVGNTCKARNLEALAGLNQSGCRVIVVSSTTIEGDEQTANLLAESGCLLWNDYIEAIEEVYGLADCYIFPTISGYGAIDLPLSVLEAMACNLPVITSTFEALPRIFNEGSGLYYVDNNEEFVTTVQMIRQNSIEIATRSKVEALNWDLIGAQIYSLYQDIIRDPFT